MTTIVVSFQNCVTTIVLQNCVTIIVLSVSDSEHVFLSADYVFGAKRIISYLHYFTMFITVFHCISLLVLVEPPAVRAKTRLLLCMCPCLFIAGMPLKVTRYTFLRRKR